MIRKVFSDAGALAKAIDGFVPRQPQTDMAMAVDAAIREQGQLVVEAGTGTGKTYAYLAPVLLSGKKAIISTGSKNLQEQLYHRDLPLMKSALGFTGTTALLKGRVNYLCPERLSRQISECHRPDSDPSQLSQLVKIREWSSYTESGDLSECDALAEDSPLIPVITSTNDNCLGKDCPSYEDCYVVKARRRAMEADVVVVNHHLFLADVAIKETGFGELIPDADIMVFDPGFRGNWRELQASPAVEKELVRLTDALELAHDVVKLSLGRSQLLDAAFDRITLFKARLSRLRDTSITGYSYWYECTRHHFSLNITPLSVADRFREQMDEQGGAWIFTSATLAVEGDFSHFSHRLGISAQRQMTLESPFDYPTQARLCVPRHVPETNSYRRADKLATLLGPVIERNQGRCFFLCTSHQMVRDLTALFRDQLEIPVLMQGEMPKQRLLAEYLSLGNALLVATGAFWEGIDVRGQALSCVIIDKLPFASPDDPLLKARIEDCKLQGGDPFSQVQIPEAVITLKQGVGRLIRDKRDQGALIICDNRLVTRPYGATFLRSLPPIPRTRDLNNIDDFLSAINADHTDAEVPALQSPIEG
ncbi:ATP-dependent helicase [Salinivibrio sp. IB574]|uniref:ATP-dependent DNA helicase n=1 Tax=Salinivibrio sp. IB574 TaxID=1909444 RepID=UPI000988D080|nr:ATP-dependent DNA helicase [Salinivibrio sp. IB574]OOF20826.1 ATP-dependent helicase [Salinivibrio sp. IB574]